MGRLTAKLFACASVLFWSLPLLAGDPSASNTPTKAAEPQAGAPASAAQDQAIDTFQVGVGFPDIRVRYKAWGPLDVEAKVAADSESVAYAARLYYNPYTVGPVKLLVGAEGGGLSFSGLDSLSGTGGYWEPFVGLQYVFIPRWSLQADVGPAWISETSHGVSVTDQQWIANFALYYAIF